MSKATLLEENVTVSVNSETNDIDITQNDLFGMFWSFDAKTGELVGT